MSVRCLLGFSVACALALGLSACTTSRSGGGEAISGTSLTVYSSLPLKGAMGAQSQAIVNGAKLALNAAGGKAGKYAITYVSLDDSRAAGTADPAATSRNARTAVANKKTIAYVGELDSEATRVSLPILSQPGIAQVGPTKTDVGLTTNKVGAQADEPGRYYPTKKRTYARIVPTDAVQGPALATAAKGAGCKTLRIWSSKTARSSGLARNVSTAAKGLGLTVEASDAIDPRASSYRQQAAAIDADCFVFAGGLADHGVQAIKDVATALPKIRLLGGDGVTDDAIADPRTGLPPAIANRFKGTTAALEPSALGAAGKKFLLDYRRTYGEASPSRYAIYGFEAMGLILDAIQRAAAKTKGKVTREAVAEALLGTRNRQSVLGTYSIDANGDTTLTDFGLYRIAGGKLRFDKVVRAKSL